MAVALRLKRLGRRKAPLYALVATDSRSRRDGRFIEDLGRYEPVQEPAVVKINAERVMYWLREGAQPSETVRALLSKEGLMLHLHLVRKGKSEAEIAEALEAFRNRGAAVKAKTTKRDRAAEALKAEEAVAKEREAAESKARAEREAELERQRVEAEAKARAEREAAAAAAAEEAQRATAEASARQAAEDAAANAPSEDAPEATGAGDVTSAETVEAVQDADASAEDAFASTESGNDTAVAPDVAPAVDDPQGRDREAMLSDVEAVPPSAADGDDLNIEGPDAAKEGEA